MRLVLVMVTVLMLMVVIPLDGPATTVTAQGCSFDYDEMIGTDPGDFNTYYTYADIDVRLHELETNHAEMMLIQSAPTTVVPWKDQLEPTWEGRENWILKIAADPTVDDPDIPDVLLVGNHHAREWSTFSTVMYFLDVVDYALNVQGGLEHPDNDGDGVVNEDGLDGRDNDGDGEDNDDDPSTPATWDGIDNDCDGLIDEGIDEDYDENWIVNLISQREVYVLPLLNPDGYEYDRTTFSGEDAWNTNPNGGWRMNLRDNTMNGAIDRDACDGVDINRNYPYYWAGPGLNEPLPCTNIDGSSVYEGPPNTEDEDGDFRLNEDPWDGVDNDGDGLIDEDRPGGYSEPETRNIRTLVENNDDDGNGRGDEFITSISYHSSGEDIFYPWGYTPEPTPSPHHEIFVGMVTNMTDMNGYRPSQGGNGWFEGGYSTSGDFTDTMFGSYGSYSFTFELGTQFHEHPAWIEPIGRRNMAPTFYLIDIAENPADAADSLTGQHTPRVVQSEPPMKRTEHDVLEFELLVNGTPSQVLLHYRTGTVDDIAQAGELSPSDPNNFDWSSWKSSTMTFSEAVQNDTTNRSELVYKASIGKHDAGTVIQYYFRVSNHHGSDEYPAAGRQDPLFTEVTFGETSWLDVGIGWGVMILLFGIIYGGLTIALRKMLVSEREKGF